MLPYKFKEIRAQLGLSQAELGKKIGKHPETIGRYERGKTVVPRAVALLMVSLAGGKE